MYGVIYVIENTVNGKRYVGQTTMNPEKRKYAHFYNLQNNIHDNSHLQASFNKYGSDAFIFNIMAGADSKEELDQQEIHFIAKYDSTNDSFGYNLKSGGSYGKHQESTKQKISKNSAKIWLGKHGKDHPLYGKGGFNGKHHSNTSKEKIRVYQLGKRHGKYQGTCYSNKKQNPWTRVWNAKIRYNNKFKSLGMFNDPISSEIVYKLVWDEIYG